jgi:hypothetical protein
LALERRVRDLTFERRIAFLGIFFAAEVERGVRRRARRRGRRCILLR